MYLNFQLKFLKDLKLSLISVLILESIFFYNFTTPEFNVNVCQLPFWSLVVFYSWKIYNNKKKLLNCFLIGLYGAIGFFIKIFVYLFINFNCSFFYLHNLFLKNKKIHFKYFIILEIFAVLLVPHIIWLFNNDFITITYGLKRAGLENSNIINHINFL